MSKLFTGGPYTQRDGTAITETSTNVNTGGMKMAGESNLVRTVGWSDGNYLSPQLVAGVNCGQAEWGSLISTTGAGGAATGITEGSNNYAGLAMLTKLNHGLVVGSVVNVTNNATGVNSTGVYAGPHRVTAVVDANRVILNTPFVSNQTGIFYSTPVGDVAHQAAGNYSMRTVSGSVHGQNNDKMSSPASDYGRNKLHQVNAVRTVRDATAVRSGDWIPFSGEFVNEPTQANDFAGFGTDEVTQNPDNGYGLKGEFQFRYGGPEPSSDDYDGKVG